MTEPTSSEDILKKVDQLLDSNNPADLQEAVSLLEQIPELDIKNENILGRMKYLYGKIYFRMGNWEKALLHLLYPFEEGKDPSKYLKDWDLVKALFLVAQCYRKTGSSVRAEDYKLLAAKRKDSLLKNEAREYFENKLDWKISFKKSLGPKFKIDLYLEKGGLGRKKREIAIWFAHSEIEVEDIRFQAREVSELVEDKYIILLSAQDQKDLEMISHPKGFKVILSFDEVEIGDTIGSAKKSLKSGW